MRTRVFPVLSFTVLAAAFAHVHAGTQAQRPALAPDEQAIARYVDAHNDEALKLLERVVNINSGTQNLAGVREVGKVFRAELDALGFTTRWIDGAAFRRAGHLVAERHGGGATVGPTILLIGHLDTVFEADSPFQKFERIGPTDQLERTKKTMQAIVVQALPHTRATLTFDEGYPPLAPTEGNRALLALYDRASRDLGFGGVVEVDPMKAGAADVSFVAGHAARILDGIGLMGADDHTVKEAADLATLPSQTKRAAILLYRLRSGR